MKIKSGYMKTETFDGWAVVPVEEESKRRKIMLTLNKTAAEIWDYLEEGKIPEEIVKGLSPPYPFFQNTRVPSAICPRFPVVNQTE